MKRERDFHRQVRVVYRACRKLYGIEHTQDECLKVFKVVFPELYKLKQSDKETVDIPKEVIEKLLVIVGSWKPVPGGQLAVLIQNIWSAFALPWDLDRELLITFYEDILPVVMRIRKLTPRECYRLQGVNEKDIDTLLNSGLSNSSHYKLAGNSICCGGNYQDKDGNWDGPMFNLFRKLFIDTDIDKSNTPIQLSLF